MACPSYGDAFVKYDAVFTNASFALDVNYFADMIGMPQSWQYHLLYNIYMSIMRKLSVGFAGVIRVRRLPGTFYTGCKGLYPLIH